jgi:hypothetical protein
LGAFGTALLENLKQVVAIPTREQSAEIFGNGLGVQTTNFINDMLQGIVQKQTQATEAFTAPITSTSNNLVGNDILKSPNQITQHQVDAMLFNYSPEERAKTMQAKGYTATYVSGVGQVWIKTGESAPLEQQQQASYTQGQRVDGNPYAIGATLAPGDRVVTKGYQTEAGTTVGSGIGVAGGTSYTDKEGNTVAQYAISYGGAGDRWKSQVQKDSEGNWVRIYYKTFSKARSRSAFNRKANNRARKKAQQDNQQATARESEYKQDNSGYNTQLVNFRADFG